MLSPVRSVSSNMMIWGDKESVKKHMNILLNGTHAWKNRRIKILTNFLGKAQEFEEQFDDLLKELIKLSCFMCLKKKY